MRPREAIGEGVASVPVEGPGLKGSWRKVKASCGSIRVPGGSPGENTVEGASNLQRQPQHFGDAYISELQPNSNSQGVEPA